MRAFFLGILLLTFLGLVGVVLAMESWMRRRRATSRDSSKAREQRE
jgi:hypothetical protein